MRSIAAIMSIGACVIAALTTAGCDSSSPPQGPEPTASTPSTQIEPGTPTGEQATQQWTMPDLVGTNLQDAQDQIQALTGGAVYFTDSHDLSGEDRNQVMDANWTVCTQNVEPGAPVTTDSRIDLGVVKLEEPCP